MQKTEHAHFFQLVDLRTSSTPNSSGSQMQFEVLRRALWVQLAQPQTVFDWKFWERAARGPKMTAYLNHGVKAKMCETTPYVNSVGMQYIAAHAKIELACDSTRKQGPALSTYIGLADGAIQSASDCNNHIEESLFPDVSNTWRSTMVMRTAPFPTELFQQIHPPHQVLLSCKPHVQDATNGDRHRQCWKQKRENSKQMSLSSATSMRSTITTTLWGSSTLLTSMPMW